MKVLQGIQTIDPADIEPIDCADPYTICDYFPPEPVFFDGPLGWVFNALNAALTYWYAVVGVYALVGLYFAWEALSIHQWHMEGATDKQRRRWRYVGLGQAAIMFFLWPLDLAARCGGFGRR